MFAMNSIQKAEGALRIASEKINRRYCQGHHIMTPANWIDDSNGLVHFSGECHVFYQRHP